MPQISQLAQTVFLALVAAVSLLLVIATRKAAPRVEVGTITARWTVRSFAVLAAWLGIPALLARAGWLARFTALPPPLMIMMVVIFAATTWLAYSDLGTRLVNGMGIQWLIGFQFFRAPLEWLLHRLFQEGAVPVQMTYAGYNFDIVTGLLALGLLFWGSAARLPRWAVVAFNLIGLVLLITIVTIAVLSTPMPIRQFHNEPPNTFIAYVPYVWLPAFLVQAAWFGHLLLLRWLRANK